jgi:hypothetical protein
MLNTVAVIRSNFFQAYELASLVKQKVFHGSRGSASAVHFSVQVEETMCLLLSLIGKCEAAAAGLIYC